MNFTFDFFNDATGQLQVTLHGFGTLSIDVPIEGGKYISGDALISYVAGIVPTWQLERIEQVQAKPSGVNEVHSMCKGKLEYIAPTYIELRAANYLAFTDFLDGMVKADADQMQRYVDRCKEVKAMYPKPAPVADEVLKSRLEL